MFWSCNPDDIKPWTVEEETKLDATLDKIFKVDNEMTLKDKGYRFCISPDKQRGRWISVIEHEKIYQDWTDHTDTPEKEFIEFLQSPIDVPSESQ